MTDQNPALHIEELALQAGLSINELCLNANVARTTLTRWKNGTTEPNWGTIRKLEKAIKNFQKKSKVNIENK